MLQSSQECHPVIGRVGGPDLNTGPAIGKYWVVIARIDGIDLKGGIGDF